MDNKSAVGQKARIGTKDIVTVGMMTAIICILAPISVPIGPVPVSLTNLIIFFAVYILGMKRATLTVVIYLLLGTAGLPVFSGYAGGLAKLLGPTGGYIIGFIPMAVIAGLVIDRHFKNRIISLLAMILSTIVLYALGTAWLAASAHMTFSEALAAGVIPFALWDLGKMVLAALLGPILKTRLLPFTTAADGE